MPPDLSSTFPPIYRGFLNDPSALLRRSPVGRRPVVCRVGCLVRSAARPGRPDRARASDRNVALAVSTLLKNEHLLRHPLDKEISERCFKTFLQSFDPMKVYFYQSDIDFFAKYKDALADEAQRGDVGFAYTVFNTFLARIDERVKMIDELLAAPHDFTVDEEMVVDKDRPPTPRRRAEARERWRKRIKYDLLVLKADEAPTASRTSSDGKTPEQRLTQRYHSFAKRMHQTDAEELLEMYLTSLTTAFDPHTDLHVARRRWRTSRS